MNKSDLTVVGIDVGGEQKGFHAVALQNSCILAISQSKDPSLMVDWCLGVSAHIIAVDAPCRWSLVGSSRWAERDIRVGGQVIQCFKTPTRERARNQSSGFYGWVFNGEKLYQKLSLYYTLFDGAWHDGPMVFETFPHAVVCALEGKVVGAKNKSMIRRKALRDREYDDRQLPNIDFVDAALCALTAYTFLNESWQCFGDKQEGLIVIPAPIV
ncbi:DUF429 domain-containing protein [uncultured Sphaerochaeta sp.]|uniref:DUF429 domain-containing protein n=1 Tax=uncultured Sphaerochaeta sp. TaxID=886478 RepID=UPI002618F4B3|nr:DUF429 domain-containing protein [uncultured Sphaerochaeta sp.]